MSVAGSAPPGMEADRVWKRTGYGSGPGMEADRVGYWLADDVEGLVAPVEIGFVSGCARI